MSDERYEDEEYDDVENSAEDEYEEEYSDDAEASDEDAIDGTDGAADGEMEHVEWGFETKKRRFSKEVVLGLVAVLGLVGVFGFVVHNQFSGGDEELASTEDGKVPAPEGTLGDAGDPNAASDPFADPLRGDAGPNAVDLNVAGPDAGALVQIGSGEPPVGDDLGGPLTGQFEPGVGEPSGAAGTADPFPAAASDSFGTPGSTDAGLNVASRDSVFGEPASGPFGSDPAVASSLPEVDPLLSQNDPSGFGTSDPAAMLPADDLLGGTPSSGAGSSSLDASPFGAEPALTGSPTQLDERPRGLFDSEPASGSLAGDQGDAFESGLPSDDGFGQPGSLNAPLPGGLGTESETGAADSLPLIANDGGLSTNDPFGQPVAGNSEPEFGSSQLGGDSLLSDSPSSPAMLGNDLLPGDPGPVQNDPFGAEPADDFKAPVVADRNDPFDGGGLTSPSAFDSSGGFETETGSATNVRPDVSPGVAAFGGSTYTVKENDSFWSISKNVYGTPRYFEALQKYNRSKVDDPKKLKPGMVLDTPSPSILADYQSGGAAASPQVIADGGRSGSGLPSAASSLPATVGTPQPASSPAGLSGDILPIEPVGGPEAVQTVASSPSTTTVGDSQQAGFFIGNQGYPMYRVANGDTLTAIAADHLGRASRWKQIFRMNQTALKSPNELAPGLVLKLPGDASRVPLIDRTSSLR